MPPELPAETPPDASPKAGFTEVEGVDYIVDYYAVLGLTREATEADIQKALREKRSQYHPDRLVKAAPELQATAKDKMDLFARAEQVLLADGKERYDELLEGFDPELVSTNGLAIVSIGRRRVVPDALVLGTLPDQSDSVSRAEQMLGYDESKLAELKALFEADPDNATIRKLYRDELNNKVGIMTIGEDAAWSAAGVLDQDASPAGMLPSPGQYVEAVAEAMAAVRDEELPRQLASHRRALGAGVGEPRLLTAGGEAGADTPDEDHLERLTTAAQEAFDRRSGAILEAAERTQEAIAELVKLTEFEYLADGPGSSPVEIVVAKDDEILTSLLASYDRDAAALSIGPSGTLESISSVTELRAADHYAAVVLVQRNPNVPSPLMEVTFVLETHFEIRTTVDEAQG
jgi:curved DNA-binding protein CbpA